MLSARIGGPLWWAFARRAQGFRRSPLGLEDRVWDCKEHLLAKAKILIFNFFDIFFVVREEKIKSEKILFTASVRCRSTRSTRETACACDAWVPRYRLPAKIVDNGISLKVEK